MLTSLPEEFLPVDDPDIAHELQRGSLGNEDVLGSLNLGLNKGLAVSEFTDIKQGVEGNSNSSGMMRKKTEPLVSSSTNVPKLDIPKGESSQKIGSDPKSKGPEKKKISNTSDNGAAGNAGLKGQAAKAAIFSQNQESKHTFVEAGQSVRQNQGESSTKAKAAVGSGRSGAIQQGTQSTQAASSKAGKGLSQPTGSAKTGGIGPTKPGTANKPVMKGKVKTGDAKKVSKPTLSGDEGSDDDNDDADDILKKLRSEFLDNRENLADIEIGEVLKEMTSEPKYRGNRPKAEDLEGLDSDLMIPDDAGTDGIQEFHSSGSSPKLGAGRLAKETRNTPGKPKVSSAIQTSSGLGFGSNKKNFEHPGVQTLASPTSAFPGASVKSVLSDLKKGGSINTNSDPPKQAKSRLEMLREQKMVDRANKTKK